MFTHGIANRRLYQFMSAAREVKHTQLDDRDPIRVSYLVLICCPISPDYFEGFTRGFSPLLVLKLGSAFWVGPANGLSG